MIKVRCQKESKTRLLLTCQRFLGGEGEGEAGRWRGAWRCAAVGTHPPAVPPASMAVKTGWACACLPTHPLGHLEGPEAQGGGPSPVTRIAAPSCTTCTSDNSPVPGTGLSLRGRFLLQSPLSPAQWVQ